MKQLFTHRWNRIAVQIAIYCFCIGTIFMLLSLTITNDILVSFGITLLVLYIPITLITLFIILINTLRSYKDIQEHTMTLIIILINIPVAILYITFLTT